jgi:glycerol uptake facilitator-like aquaporin
MMLANIIANWHLQKYDINMTRKRPKMTEMQNKIMTQFSTEFFGTALLLAIVTGSGIMGETLSNSAGAGNAAVALLGNSIATGCGLYVLISLFGPISGAHFNPVVSIMMWRNGTLNSQTLFGYVAAQITGAIAGVWLTHLLFSLPVIQASTKPRHGLGIWVSEFIATLILLGVIRLGIKYANEKVPMLVALTVTAGYWFTSSTFFANPAVTLARSLTNTFVGIAPADIIGFVSAQLAAVLLICLLIKAEK